MPISIWGRIPHCPNQFIGNCGARKKMSRSIAQALERIDAMAHARRKYFVIISREHSLTKWPFSFPESERERHYEDLLEELLANDPSDVIECGSESVTLINVIEDRQTARKRKRNSQSQTDEEEEQPGRKSPKRPALADPPVANVERALCRYGNGCWSASCPFRHHGRRAINRKVSSVDAHSSTFTLYFLPSY